MKKEKIERIQRISEWMRYILLALLLAFLSTVFASHFISTTCILNGRKVIT